MREFTASLIHTMKKRTCDKSVFALYNFIKTGHYAMLHTYIRHSYFLKIRVELFPPKPNEFETAAFISFFIALLGI